MWITAGGSRYHRSTSCAGLKDGYAKAAELGLVNHPVKRTTEEAALQAGRAPCSRCAIDALSSVVPEWESFLSKHDAVLRETPFEREFVIRVLAQVTGLRAGEVHPQETVVDGDGRSRRIDFAVRRGELKLALEVDGAEKVTGEPGLSGGRLDDALRRQNSLVAAGWRVLRFSNGQVMLESAVCARTIAEQLAGLAVVGPPPVAPTPLADGATRGPSETRSSKTGWFLAAAAVAVGVVAAGVVLAGGDGGSSPPSGAAPGGGPLSEVEQRRVDIEAGAVAPVSKDDCPSSHPVKANYRPDRQTKFYFVEADGDFFQRADPTSCWQDVASAKAGGYGAGADQGR